MFQHRQHRNRVERLPSRHVFRKKALDLRPAVNLGSIFQSRINAPAVSGDPLHLREQFAVSTSYIQHACTCFDERSRFPDSPRLQNAINEGHQSCCSSRMLRKKLEKIVWTPSVMHVTAGITRRKLSGYEITPK